jgi:hypothetical protein
LERYVNYTDNLINAIQHFDTDEDGNSVPADYVIYLDKSARPVAWMTRELWPTLTEADAQGESPKMPEMRFLNIDRMPWRINPGVEIGQDPSNFREPDEEDIIGLRSIFTAPGKDPSSPGQLDGKRILVVDEVSDSGDTLRVSTQLLERAFPDAVIKGANWMDVHTQAGDRQQSKQVLDRPVWYEAKEESGRGVFGHTSEGAINANTKSTLTPGAHQFLSTRPIFVTQNESGEATISHVDQRGLALRRDIKRMAQALKDGAIVPAPSTQHEKEYNGMDIDDYALMRSGILKAREEKKRQEYLASLKKKK